MLRHDRFCVVVCEKKSGDARQDSVAPGEPLDRLHSSHVVQPIVMAMLMVVMVVVMVSY